jgi:Caspase domain
MPPAPEPLPGTRLALVVATGIYNDAGLGRLRAPARDAADLAQVLADPGIGGFTVTTVIDQPAQQVRLAVEDFLAERGTGDLLLVYLSCHGLLDARRRLYFAAADTRKDRLGATGVESAWVLDQLEHCRARRQVLILDSCFSGAFAHGAKGDTGLDLQDRFLGDGRGRVVLTASTATEYSFEGEPTDAATQTGSVFTAALVHGLRTGAADTDHDGHVSVDDAYAYVFDQVQASGAAQTPQRWLYGGEGTILLARSPTGPAVIPAEPPVLAARIATRPGEPDRKKREPARVDGQERATRLLEEALRAAHSITDEVSKASTLGDIAKTLAGTDPDRAEDIAQSITDHRFKMSALAFIAASLAVTDPDRAERITRSANGLGRGRVLANIAGSLAVSDPDRAVDIAESITDEAARQPALSGVVQRLAASDPDRAERIAQSMAWYDWGAPALASVAAAVAATDPDRAARLLADAVRKTQSIDDEESKARTLVHVSEAVAATDPDRAARLLADAEHTARSITDPDRRAYPLSTIVQAMAPTDPDHAERIAQSITHESDRDSALSAVIQALAASDPDRAEQICQAIASEYGHETALASFAVAVAATDPDRAVRIAQSIPYQPRKALTLSKVARRLGVTDPDRANRLLTDAERIARSITNEKSRALALMEIARSCSPG